MKIEILKVLTIACLFASAATAQSKPAEATPKEPAAKAEKKVNQRPVAAPQKTPPASEPFDKADVKTLAAQCVKFETEAGSIELELYPESAPETVRSFLNLAVTGAFDTTTFSRVVPNFIIQGGNLFTREKLTPEMDKRARRTIPDEPSQIKHERGIISMARPETPNGATTDFFILVSAAPNLDGDFSAFGRVIKGMETVDAINKMPVEGEKPTKPIHITRATVAPCPVQPKQ